MPPPNLPPTPAPSTDISGQHQKVGLAPALTLPPSAYGEASDRPSSSTPSTSNGSDSSYRPVSPTSPNTLSRKRTASQSRASKSDDAFTLPPPPTRSRKIIQMKPKGGQNQQAPIEPASVAETAQATGSNGTSAGGKKGKNNGNTAAGRKIARKTAHSLIERRRRSKMNEEFGVLKDLIPACRGQEMHKLAILQVRLFPSYLLHHSIRSTRIRESANPEQRGLTPPQASIDYLRYLEDCITDLQANQTHTTSTHDPRPSTSTTHTPRLSPTNNASSPTSSFDEPMPDSTAPTPPLSRPSLISSSLSATHGQTHGYAAAQRHYSISSASASASATASQPSFSPYLHSAHTSPFFGPSGSRVSVNGGGGGGGDLAGFSLTSPALRPVDDGVEALKDQEAMAALMMLNRNQGVGARRWEGGGEAQRRGGDGGGAKAEQGRHMSVQDLLG